MSRHTADQGDFYFTLVKNSSGEVIPHPVFILGKNGDSNDTSDVIACMRTTKKKRTDYDIETIVGGRKGWVRTNKILTIERRILESKMSSPAVTESIKKEIIKKAIEAISFKIRPPGSNLKMPDTPNS